MAVFDLTGGAFLVLYAVLFFLALIASLLLSRWLRPEGRMTPLSDPEHLAFLAGGTQRFVEAVVAKLLASKALVAGARRIAINDSTGGTTAAERKVLGLGVAASWKDVVNALTPEAKRIDDVLSGYGLLIDSANRRLLRWRQASPYLVLIAFGAIKWALGNSRGKPVGFLTAFMVVTAIVAVVRYFALDPRTRAGKEVVRNAAQTSSRLRRSPMEAETGMAVALFGTTVLAGSQYSAFHEMRSSDSSGSSSDSSSSSGCSGGGNSGCGGCGGGGD